VTTEETISELISQIGPAQVITFTLKTYWPTLLLAVIVLCAVTVGVRSVGIRGSPHRTSTSVIGWARWPVYLWGLQTFNAVIDWHDWMHHPPLPVWHALFALLIVRAVVAFLILLAIGLLTIQFAAPWEPMRLQTYSWTMLLVFGVVVIDLLAHEVILTILSLG
jgi:hypothetical protein